ncbi:MAG: hypothetical protein SPF89_00355 [Sphaerochaetaceae bacterium]|nr:hypothetical protein [Spirochaetales bacterium]MDY5498535.1 hypothetical protein [Sphaerochaetaceae bacterium]
MWFTLYRNPGKLKYEPSAAWSVLSGAGGNPFCHCIFSGFVASAFGYPWAKAPAMHASAKQLNNIFFMVPPVGESSAIVEKQQA